MADIRKTEDLSTRVQLSFLEKNTMSDTSNTQPSHKDAAIMEKQAQANALCLEKLHDHAHKVFGKFAEDFDRFFDKARLEDGSVDTDSCTKLGCRFDWYQDEGDCIELETFESVARTIYGETGCEGLRYVWDVPQDLLEAFQNPNCQIDIEDALAKLIDGFVTIDVEPADGHWEPECCFNNMAHWQVDSWFLKLGWDRFNKAPREEVINSVLDAVV